MSKKKENERKLKYKPKWIPAGASILLIIVLVILLPNSKILSLRTLFLPKLLTQPQTKLIPVTVYPMNETSKDGYINMALDDLSKTKGMNKTMISVKSTEAIDWGDSSLGCPKKGMMYAQVITPGYKIILSVQGQDYDYHAGSERVVFCPDN